MGKDTDPAWTGYADTVGSLIERQLAAAQSMEEDAIDGFQHLVDRWCERRHRMVGAYTRFAQSAFDARGPQDLAQAWLDLTKGTIERLAEDARDQMEVGASMAHTLAKGPMALTPVVDETPARRGSRSSGVERSATTRH